MNKVEVIRVLNQLQIKPRKELGQNFIVEENSLNKILSFANLSQDDIVLEVGAGLGGLTEKLVEKAKKVYAFELDKKLCDYLSEKFSTHNNIEIFYEDILRANLPSHNKVVSNLPYTITGPLLEKLFYRQNSPEGTIVIEKKIADRIFSHDRHENFSRISVTSNSFVTPVARSDISKNSFYPVPRIDLSLVKILPKYLDPFLVNSSTREFFMRFIAWIMPYKNKDLIKALELGLRNYKERKVSKEEIINALSPLHLIEKKLFNVPIEKFLVIAKNIHSLKI